MKIFKIKSYCKINLTLKIIKKLKSGYHNISSLITFAGLHDIISISKTNNSKDIVIFLGKFKEKINQKSNTITKVLDLLRKYKYLKDQSFKIVIKKNIPHGSGLGGGSSNAANLLNYFNLKMKLKLNNKKLSKMARKIGSDVPIILKRKNTFLTGKGNQMFRLNKKFRFNLLIVYPNIICSTKKIYQGNKLTNLPELLSPINIKKNKKLMQYLIKEGNDLEKIVIKNYPKVKTVINFIKSQKGCYFSRITGSGSACIGIFSSMHNAIYVQKLIKRKYPRYWCVVSKTI